MNVFNYKIFEQTVEPINNHIIKIYSLLGKRFAEHHIKFIIDANKINISEEGMFEGKVSKILDYIDEKYYFVQVDDKEILINAKDTNFKEGETIKFDLINNEIGLIDTDFGVRII